MEQIPNLQTERLVLRAPCELDAQAYRDFYADGAFPDDIARDVYELPRQ